MNFNSSLEGVEWNFELMKEEREILFMAYEKMIQ